MTDAVKLAFSARTLADELPPMLKAATRSTGAEANDRAADEFLPPGYLTPVAAYDLGAAARGTAAGTAAQSPAVAADEVLVIELADRSTLVTTAPKLKASLERSRPDLIAADGSILFDRLRAEGAASRGVLSAVVGGLVSRVFRIKVAPDDPILADARAKAVELGADPLAIGVSWLGTKALMWAIEKRLLGEPGMFAKWSGALGGTATIEPLDDAALTVLETAADPAAPKPLLVFVHGTGSNTLGSFGDLRAGDRDVWNALDRRFTGGIYAFEHRTLSESPIDNAIELAKQLPQGAHVSLVSHSRGGLVCDLLCLGDFDALIPNYRSDVPRTGDADPAEADRVLGELKDAHGEQRARLAELAALLRERRLVIERYVRVASPGRGTRLASGDFDVFLSSLLTLIGQVPFFFGQPAYLAFKRVAIEIARNRTNPHLVPGIEAMLPDAPMARLLRDAPVRPGIQMAVIAGDIEGGTLLQRLGVLLTDFLLFDSVDNDLVVDTNAMLAGIAPQTGAKALFDRGAEVSHFRYFTNLDTRVALRDWLVAPDPSRLDAFQPMPQAFDEADTLEAEDARLQSINRHRGTDAANLPVVVILPGVMGSHLWVDRRDRVWFDPLDVAGGGLDKIAWKQPNVEAEKLFSTSYGRLADHLARSHRVERFAYDWRQPLDVLGERFGEYLATLLKGTDRPIRLLAHSMGGLVVRACIYRRRAVIDEAMQRDGARLVMLGTPNQGAHSMVANLLGKGDTLRTLVRLDLKHDMQQVLDLIGEFRGALQLLPKPGFVDTFQGTDDGGIKEVEGAYCDTKAFWDDLKTKNKDFWFGDGNGATPKQDVLDAATWLWKQDGRAAPALPDAYEAKTVYVCGVAPNTPCGVRVDGGRLKLVGTTRGDGTVTWDSGRIKGIGRTYYMPAEHGALPSTDEYFPALADLLAGGTTAKLMTAPPAVRAAGPARPVVYDAGPPTVDDGQSLVQGLMGAGGRRPKLVERPKRRLEVEVQARDLRFVNAPILVGHYEHDPIAGPQKLIDRELLDGELSERYSLGLYAGPRGTATVVLRAPNAQERRRRTFTGAVVAGLGPYEKPMSLSDLTESVRAGVLRFLLQATDVLGKDEIELPLAAVLVGYNSSANLTVADSVEALVRGVLEANARFFETTRLDIRVAKLELVELYLDTAITAVYALRELGPKLGAAAKAQRSLLVCNNELTQGEGVRQRLFDNTRLSYWPRLIVTDADRRTDGDAPAPVPAASTAPAAPPARTAIAVRLRFLYVGQRARAESVVQQRQPGLVEALVRQQIAVPQWNEDVGRMLFQLMVPHDLKDAARQLDRVVLVVDPTTANLPWELMLADPPGGDAPVGTGAADESGRAGDQKLPLALRTPVVRQLESTRFRRQVRQNFERSALVVGNPSVQGFATAYGLKQDPAALGGAEEEARAVVTVLNGMDYQVVAELGPDRQASDVLAALYRRAYRIVHVSAHGVFDLPHRDGLRRSGVVLSDGLLITAAEIDAMETVPELVFLNCCHLGQIDQTVRDGNRLAASVAAELIQIGVRCVVVAGWAVDDQGARIFGETLYRQLLLERQPFGIAVFKARQAVWSHSSSDITWGAFQAYGDAGWMAEPVRGGGDAPSDERFASPDEALDELARLRADLSHKKTRLTDRDKARHVRSVEHLKERLQPGWLDAPMLQSALGRTWAELGEFELAREAYLAAVQAEDLRGQVPIRDIEQLASAETRLGETRRDEGQIRRALGRLDELDRLVSTDGSADAVVHAERSALRGSGWKRLASLHARRVLAPGATEAAIHDAGERMRVALTTAAAAYGRAEGAPGQPHFSAYHALNRLALEALTAAAEGHPAQRKARVARAIDVAQQCRASAEGAFVRGGGFYDAMTPPEADLVERLLDGRLGLAGDDGDRALDEVAAAYAGALSNITLTPKELDAVVDQLCLLSRFCDALWSVARAGKSHAVAEARRRTADRLIVLAEGLQPGGCRRDDRPRTATAEAPAAPEVPAAAPAAKAPRKASRGRRRAAQSPAR